ncbi:DUF2490 domain-containing protein [bacterium]|nr:DUF2490 domain-containing protein [bacterium]
MSAWKLFPALVLLTLPSSVFGETEIDYWPEIQFYHKLNQPFRIRLLTGFTRSQPFGGGSDGFVEFDLDIWLKKIVKIKEQIDDHKGKYLSMRMGYSYHFFLSDDGSSPENRGILELTGRLPLPKHFLLSDRHRVDLRWIGDDQTYRYRNKIKLETSFRIGRFEFNPYTHAEFYYDSRVDGWNRNEYCLGSEFPIRKHFVLEYYYTRQVNRGSGSSDVNGIGSVFQLHW